MSNYNISGQTAPRQAALTLVDNMHVVHKEEVKDMEDEELTGHTEVIISGL